MGSFLSWVQNTAQTLGAPGLFLVGLLDSTFIPLPEANDLLLVWMVTHDKSRMVLYATTAVLGSLAGCLLLYYIGRRGGDSMVRSRFSSERVDKALGTLQRYGVIAVLVPCLLPPPAPFKIFMLLAGVAGISVGHFVVAIVIGRVIRFFALGMLAVRYGDDALEYIQANEKAVSLGLLGAILAALAAYIVWSKARARKAR